MEEKETVPERSTLVGKEHEWSVIKRFGAGAFGDVYWIVSKKTWKHNVPCLGEPRIQAAMKVSDDKDVTKLLHHELQCLEDITRSNKAGFPTLLDRGKASYTKNYDSGQFNWIAIELIGSSFDKFTGDTLMSLNCSLECVKQLLKRIQELHQIGYVHRDLKPANCGIGLVPYHRIVYLLDFGMCKQLRDPKSGAKRTGSDVWRGIKRGTLDYMPLGPHNGYETVPLDEIESWFYTAIKIVTDKLPWEPYTRMNPPNETMTINMKQMFWTSEDFARSTVLKGCPKQFLKIWKDLTKMTLFEKKHQKPDYHVFIKHLEAAQRKYRPEFDWEKPITRKRNKNSKGGRR